jgi:transposase
VLAVARHEHPILEHLHLWQDVFQEVYSAAVAEPTLYRWRDEFLAAGEAALANGRGKKGADPRDRRIAELEQQIEKRDQVIGEYTIANRILKKLSGQSV